MLVPHVRLGIVDVQFAPVVAGGQEVIDREVLVDEDRQSYCEGPRSTISRIRVPVLWVSEPPGRTTACSKLRSHSGKRCWATSSRVQVAFLAGELVGHQDERQQSAVRLRRGPCGRT